MNPQTDVHDSIQVPTITVRGQRYSLSTDRISIGRGADNDIVIDDGSVSTHHCEIVHHEGRFMVRDLGSTNGTKLNGDPVLEAALADGDVINFGSVVALFKAAAEVSQPPVENQEVVSDLIHSPGSDATTAGSVGSKLAKMGSSAWQETKRNSRLISLKAQIQKLKQVDLRQAFHDLGRKCYELKVYEDQLPEQFKEIAALEHRIEENRKDVQSAEGATRMEKAKAWAEDGAKKVAAEALSLQLYGLFIELGKFARPLIHGDGECRLERDRIEELKAKLKALEDECDNCALREVGAAKRNFKLVMISGVSLLLMVLTMGLIRYVSATRAHNSEIIGGGLGITYGKLLAQYDNPLTNADGSQFNAGDLLIQPQIEGGEMEGVRYIFRKHRPSNEELEVIKERHRNGFSWKESGLECRATHPRQLGGNLKLRFTRDDMGAVLEVWEGNWSDGSTPCAVWVATTRCQLRQEAWVRRLNRSILIDPPPPPEMSAYPTKPLDLPLGVRLSELRKIYKGLIQDEGGEAGPSRSWKAFYCNRPDRSVVQVVAENNVVHFVQLAFPHNIGSEEVDTICSQYSMGQRWRERHPMLRSDLPVFYREDNQAYCQVFSKNSSIQSLVTIASAAYASWFWEMRWSNTPHNKK